MTHCFKNIFTVQNGIKQIYCEIVFVKNFPKANSMN